MKRALVTAIWVMAALVLYLLFVAELQHGKTSWEAFRSILFSPLCLLPVIGFVMRPMLVYLQRLDPPSLDYGEALFHACWVVYPIGWDLVGGGLYVTTQRVIFCPCRINFHKVSFTVPLDQINEASVFWPRFELQYRLAITDRAGHRTEFVIGRHSKTLAEKIMQARKANGS